MSASLSVLLFMDAKKSRGPLVSFLRIRALCVFSSRNGKGSRRP